MKVIDKPLIIGGTQLGVFQSYIDIEDELQITPDTPRMSRVLPAPFFYEKRLFFYLIRMWMPGEKKSFPNGGFEVRDEGGAMRSYDLDQVVIHPLVIKHKKTLEKMLRRAEKESKKRERKRLKFEREMKPKQGRRGRPALDPALKVQREANKAQAQVRSGGKRGRPKSTTPKVVSAVLTPKTGKRGRPPLSLEARAKKEADLAAVAKRSGGKRGRPKRS